MTQSVYTSHQVILSDKVADDSAGRIDPLTQSESSRGRESALFKLSTYVAHLKISVMGFKRYLENLYISKLYFKTLKHFS